MSKEQHLATITAVKEWLSAIPTKFTRKSDPDTILQQLDATLTHCPPIEPEQLRAGIAIANELVTTTTEPFLVCATLLLPYLQQNSKACEMLPTNSGFVHLVAGVEKMGLSQRLYAGNSADILSQSTELRQMLLAMVDDIRVVIIKLCEQLSAIRALPKTYDPELRWQAEQGLHLYASLANRLGLGQLKWMLEDLSFRYLEADTYKQISKMLHQRRTEREAYIQSFKKTFGDLLQENNSCSVHHITGRAKHIYSIYKKCKRKEMPFETINDASAIRVLVPTIADCYAALSEAHANWEHVSDEFDDYISQPKPNGYRSLHTVIHGPDNTLVEIQIRTFDMHEEAELGVAAHWKYKDSRSSDAKSTTRKVDWLQTLLGWQEEINQDQDRAVYRDVFQDRIYVFTPDSKVIDLPLESTPLDFAYHIHTQVGHSCRGAKVNGKIVQLTHKLKTGDQVQILTQKNATPSRDWLRPQSGYLHSRHAKQKLRSYFRKEFYDEYVANGHAQWDKHFHAEKIDKATLQKLYQHFNFKRQDDLLCAIGGGDIHMGTVLNQLRKLTNTQAITETIVKKKQGTGPASSAQASTITIEGVANLLTQLAKCCHPIPGDPVLGYITKLGGVSIHHAQCHNIIRAQQTKPDRVVAVEWGSKQSAGFPVRIQVTCINNNATDKAVISFVSAHPATIISHSSELTRNKANRIYRYQLEVSDQPMLRDLLIGLSNISGVTSAIRQGEL